MNCYLISIGDEILNGQTLDTNTYFLAQSCRAQGYQVRGIYSIPDQLEAIVDMLNQIKPTADVIVTTGGLGPTKDDITKKSIAAFLGVEMFFHQATEDRIKGLFAPRKIPFTEEHRQQCFFPDHVELLENNLGTAPGMWWELEDHKVLISLPGVPYEMKHLWTDRVMPRLQARWHSSLRNFTLMTAGTGETVLSSLLHEWEEKLPASCSIAYLPDLGRVRLRLTCRDAELPEARFEQLKAEMEHLVKDYVFGYEGETLPEALGQLLLKQGKSLGLAESCTGGYLSHLITGIPGSSAYYNGGIVSYSNAFKEAMLGVSSDTLNTFGAVSRETVLEMVQGILKQPGVDVGIAISGIAGPDGGTPEKPVGTIWIAYGDKKSQHAVKILFTKSRLLNIEYAAYYSLNLLRKFLLGL
ncbi:MAG: CinA family nicotinamide mononucleotide deamidase-related protein [Saprospiraceae bacterium]|nr:CinA family nicotinamide mononucleotide deamidase-related protein [Saprospiraceae bacterium]HPG05875.1 CinA family nicotinamide mononucleotide deamidase-related protein [Saprospiraceae bacterium]